MGRSGRGAHKEDFRRWIEIQSYFVVIKYEHLRIKEKADSIRISTLSFTTSSELPESQLLHLSSVFYSSGEGIWYISSSKIILSQYTNLREENACIWREKARRPWYWYLSVETVPCSQIPLCHSTWMSFFFTLKKNGYVPLEYLNIILFYSRFWYYSLKYLTVNKDEIHTYTRPEWVKYLCGISLTCQMDLTV